jgi:hypothetical protein
MGTSRNSTTRSSYSVSKEGFEYDETDYEEKTHEKEDSELSQLAVMDALGGKVKKVVSNCTTNSFYFLVTV